MMQSRFIFIVLSLSFMFLCSCEDKDHRATHHGKNIIVEAKKSTQPIHLYYEGRIIPLNATSVTSPIDAEVNQVLVHPGEYVKKSQALASLSSTQLANDFHSSISNYFQRKSSYQRALENLEATKALHKAGAISEEEYQNSRNTMDSSYLDYFQAKQALKKIMQLAQMDDLNIEKIDLTNTEKINKLLSMDFNNIKITAPIPGNLLTPPPNDSGSTNPVSIGTGSHVTAGQVLWLINDPNQLGVVIMVHEVDINRIKLGDAAIVTGSGFMGGELKGTVIEVAPEAQPTAEHTNNLSLFKVVVRITPEKNLVQKVRMGMTAKVDILIQQSSQVSLPLQAITTENQKQWVEKINPQTHAIEKTSVITGETNLNDVNIVQGVNSGDKVLIHE